MNKTIAILLAACLAAPVRGQWDPDNAQWRESDAAQRLEELRRRMGK